MSQRIDSLRRPPRSRAWTGALGLALLTAVRFDPCPAHGQTAECPPVAERLKVKAGDPAAGDLFGCALALIGELLLVGSIGDDDRGADAGAVYPYRLRDGVWTPLPKLLAGDGAAGDQLGYAVALSPPLAVVGAPYKSAGGAATGAAYVAGCGAEGCGPATPLVPSQPPAPQDQLGFSVAVDAGAPGGAVAAVGAPGADGAGAVEVFRQSGGVWLPEARLRPSGGAAGDGFGFAVAVRGDTLVVGSPYAAGGGGAVRFFVRAGGVWQEQARRTAPAGRLGYAVALGGDAALVGAPGSGGAAGSAALFAAAGGAWNETRRLSAGGAGDRFGASLAVAGGRFLIGAFLADDPVLGVDAGAAYLVDGGETLRLSAGECGGAGDGAGLGTGLSADFALVGAFHDDEGAADSGAAYAFLLTEEPPPPPTADLAVAIAGGRGEVCAGGEVTYEVTVANHGPDDVDGARARVDFPPALAPVAWSCRSAGDASCGTGVGDVDDRVALPAGSARVYTATATVAADYAGPVVTTATATPPAGIADPAPGNNAVRARADTGSPGALTVAFDDGVDAATPGDTLRYLLTISNDGSCPARAVPVRTVAPPGFTPATWSCAAPPGGACTAAGEGEVADTPTIPGPGSVVYVLTGTVVDGFAGELRYAAAIRDPGTRATIATSDRTVVFPDSGAAVAKTVDVRPAREVVYGVLLLNGGPGDLASALFIDTIPQGLELLGADAASGELTVDSEKRTVEWRGTLVAGEPVAVEISARASPGARQPLCNQGFLTVLMAPPLADEVLSDDPTVTGAADPTCFFLTEDVVEVPALTAVGGWFLIALLSAAGLAVLRRRGRFSAERGHSSRGLVFLPGGDVARGGGARGCRMRPPPWNVYPFGLAKRRVR